MTLGFITSSHRGSCAVHGHHELGESTHFANIEVKVRTKKRPRSHHPSGFVEKTYCHITVSVWKTLESFSSHSVAKSFSHVYNFRRQLKSWNDAKILAIHDVSQVSNFVHGTCFGLALYGGGNRYGTVMGIIRESETILLPIVVHDKEPVSAVMLRGPTLLCVYAPGIVVLERDGVKHAVNGFDFAGVGNNMTSVCNVEDESYALACSTTSHDDSRSVFQISSIHWKGNTAALFSVEDQFDSFATLRAASLYRRQLFFSTVGGVLHAIDMGSRTNTWRSRMHSDVVKQVRVAMLYNGLLILSTLSESEDFYAAHVATPLDSSHCVGDVRKLFSTRCGQEKGEKHIHFYIPWQNLLLKVNCEGGTCCDEEDSYENCCSNSSSGNPSMFQIESHLCRRLEKGIDQFLEDRERINDKQKMMENVRALLTEELGHRNMKSFAPIFDGRVTCIASIPHRSAQNARQDQQQRTCEEPVSEQEPGGSPSLDSDSISHPVNTLKLIDSSCQLDRLRSCVTIETQFLIDEVLFEQDEKEKKPVRAKLRLHNNERIPSVWSCNEISVSEKPGQFTLWAVSPLAVFTNSSNLSNVTFTATIEFSNGLSHPVGLFTLASLMRSTKKVDNPSLNTVGNVFPNAKYYISASGGNKNHLMALLAEDDIARYAKFEVGEHAIRITLDLASQNEFSIMLATLRLRAGDGVNFQSTPEPCKRSLFEADTGITLLEDEKKLLQSLISEKNVFGYTTEEVVSVIEKQIDVDDAFGLIEEQQLWL